MGTRFEAERQFEKNPPVLSLIQKYGSMLGFHVVSNVHESKYPVLCDLGTKTLSSHSSAPIVSSSREGIEGVHPCSAHGRI